MESALDPPQKDRSRGVALPSGPYHFCFLFWVDSEACLWRFLIDSVFCVERARGSKSRGCGSGYWKAAGSHHCSLISTFEKIRRGALSLAGVVCELDLKPTNAPAGALPSEGHFSSCKWWPWVRSLA